jgi:hypothetical protein
MFKSSVSGKNQIVRLTGQHDRDAALNTRVVSGKNRIVRLLGQRDSVDFQSSVSGKNRIVRLAGQCDGIDFQSSEW